MSIKSLIVAEGRRRLKRLIPIAKERYERMSSGNDVSAESGSAMGGALFDQIELDHLHAVVVYQNPRGWYADVILRNQPIGLPDSFGTPASMPLATEVAAEEAALTLVVTVVAAIEQRKRKKPLLTDVAVFKLCGEELLLRQGLLQELKASGELEGLDEDEIAALGNHILATHVMQILEGKPFTLELFDAAPQELRNQCHIGIALLMLSGVFSWPAGLTTSIDIPVSPMPNAKVH